jgi:threonine aldolase
MTRRGWFGKVVKTEMAARYDFASDNVAGAMPEALQALIDHNAGYASGYGTDHVSRQAADLIRALVDADAEVRFTASGTAANSLTVAALAAPHEAVICHAHAHIATDETGAPGFFGSGLGLVTLPGASGRIDQAALAETLAEPEVEYHQSPAALSITNATEYGALYAEADVAAIAGAAKAKGLKLHHDGARLANAVAAGFPIKALPKLGFDVLVIGGTKAGGTPTEAIVLLDRALARRFDARMKHGGQLVSKARYLAAPWIGMLESGAWERRAAHANAMAKKLAGLMPFPIKHPVDVNGIFVEMDAAAHARLRAEGWFVYRFLDGTVRFMCSWATTEEAVEAIGAALKKVA